MHAPHTRPVHLLINKKAGSVLREGEESIRALIAQSGLPVKSLNLLDAEQIAPQIDAFMEDDLPVLIGGGDGTIASCLPYFIERKRILGVLPLGTMNLLARDLGLSGDLAEALGQYTRPMQVAEVDVGYVNDRPFLCCAGLGTMPESAVYRENMRGDSALTLYPRLIKFIFDQMDPHNQRRLTLHIDGRRRTLRSAALVVSNNPFSNYQDDEADGFLQRPSLQSGRLGIYSFAPRSLGDKLSLLLRLRLGGWKSNTRLREWQGRTASVDIVDSAESKALVSIDGEVAELVMPLQFRIEPESLSVMMPCRREPA